MSVYRYRLSGPSARRVGNTLDVVPTIGQLAPPVFVDITTTGSREDLDDAMLIEGYVYDSTDPTNTVEQAAANVTVPVGQVREVAKSGKPFTSIEAALADITDASSVKPYEVVVYPGVYTENPLVMKPYVHVRGVGGTLTVKVQTNNNSANFITAKCAAQMSNLWLVGPTGSGYAAVDMQDTGFVPFFMDQTVISVGYYGLHVHPAAAVGAVVANNTSFYYTGASVNQFVRTTGYGSTNLSSTVFTGGPPGSLTRYIHVSGPNARLTSSVGTLDISGADGLFADDGAQVSTSSMKYVNCAAAIHIGATGTGTIIRSAATITSPSCTKCVWVETSTGLVSFVGFAEPDKIDAPDGTVFGSIVNSVIGASAGITNLGGTFLTSNAFPLDTFVDAIKATGVHGGGGLERVSGRDVKALAGHGFVVTGAGVYRHVMWADATVTIPANTTTYVYVNSSGSVTTSTTRPTLDQDIMLGIAVTNASAVTFIIADQVPISQGPAALYHYNREVIGPINFSGGVVTKNANPSVQLDVTGSEYYTGLEEVITTGGAAVSWTYWRSDGAGGWIPATGVSSIDTDKYDASGTLTVMTAGKYKRDLLFVSKSDSGTEYHVVYGQQQFDSAGAALLNPLVPPFLQTDACRLAAIIVLHGATDIDSIVDQRPRIGQLSAGTAGVTVHNDLTGRDSATAHTQYQLMSEKGAASGYAPLDASTKVANTYLQTATAAPGTVAVGGAAVGSGPKLAFEDHNHSLSTGSPVAVGTTNNDGTSTAASRADHVHAHGSQTDGTLHAAATTSVAGFLSAADKTKLDGVATGATNVVKATAAELNTGTDDAKFATALGLENSKYLDQDGSKLYGVAAGTDTYTVTLTPAPTAYAAGNAYLVKFTNANTGAATINVNALGAKSIVKGATTALVAGDIPAGRIALLVYDGTNFLLNFMDTTAVHSNVTGEINALTSKATPVAADVLVIEDSAASFAKKKVTASSLGAAAALTSSVTTATGTITTTSATPVLATSMTVTPAAGTYLVFFTGSCYQGTTGAGLWIEVSIYAGGSQNGASRLILADSPNFNQAFTSVAIVTVNGSQAIEGRWRRTAGAGTASMLGTRTLTTLKIG